MAGVDINTLTLEQCLALSRDNQTPSVVKPEIEGNVNFKIKSQFMSELREDTFFGNKDEDAHDHIDRNRKQMGGQTRPGTTNTWDLLKKAFIQRYFPPSMTTKQLEDIHNFKQEEDKSLYQAWEQYNNLLYKCPTHDINSHQKVNIFYKGLSTMNRQLLDLQGPIPKIRPFKALTAIQTMADHSQKWHDGTTSRKVESSNSSDGLVALVNKLDNLGRDMKKLKEVFMQSKSDAKSVKDLTSTNIVPSMRKLSKYKSHDSERRNIKGKGLCFSDFLLAKYGKRQTDTLIWDSRYAKWYDISPSSDASSQESSNPRPRDYTFRVWTMIKVGHTDEFNLEIDNLADEYELGIGKKGYILDHIWEYCNQVRNKNYEWHNYEFENKECDDMGIEDKEYHLPEVQVETFEVKKYSFNGGKIFISVTKDLDNALPHGRKNGSKFKEMIQNEVASNKT
ncbi:copia protein [Tanacetum coccineum]